MKKATSKDAFATVKNSCLLSMKTLHELGYEIEVASAPRSKKEYIELHLIIFKFANTTILPSLPKGFDLCHIQDEQHSVLLCKMADSDSIKDMVANLLTASSNLLEWTSCL